MLPCAYICRFVCPHTHTHPSMLLCVLCTSSFVRNFAMFVFLNWSDVNWLETSHLFLIRTSPKIYYSLFSSQSLVYFSGSSMQFGHSHHLIVNVQSINPFIWCFTGETWPSVLEMLNSNISTPQVIAYLLLRQYVCCSDLICLLFLCTVNF